MLLIILLVHLFLLVNTRFTLWPEMVVYPYLINQNFALYTEIINPYPPLLPSLLAIFARIFGYQPLPYQILTWIITLTVDLEIFFISKAIFKKGRYGLLSTLFFVIFSIPFAVNGLWFDLVQTPFILGAIFFLYRYLRVKLKKYLFFTFFLLTIAFFIKQQIMWLFLWVFVLIIFKFKKKAFKILSDLNLYIPFLVFLIFFVITFYQKGTLGEFFYWSAVFPFWKAATLPGYAFFPNLKQIAIIGALLAFFMPTLVKDKFKIIPQTALILTLFIFPRFDYFHLISALTILSIGFAYNCQKLFSLKIKYQALPLASFAFLTFFGLRSFINNWTNEIRFFEKDIYAVAAFLSRTTAENEAVYIQNGPDQLLPISGRLPTKPWVDEFPWYLELPGMQEKVVEGIKAQNPRFIIYKPYDAGPVYEIGSYRPSGIALYIDENYKNLMQISQNLWLKIKI